MERSVTQSPYDKYWNCFVFEFIGSFFIVFAIQNAHTFQYGVFAIAISFFLSVFIAAKISGAHLNSAVTLTIYLNEMKDTNGKPITPIEKYYGYVIAQILGGTAAGLVTNYMFGEDALVDLGVTGVPGSTAFVLEMLYSGLLCFMVSIICDEHYSPKPEAALVGLLVTGVIFVQANAIGAWTGGVINPSIGVSLILARCLAVGNFTNFNRVVLYIIAPCVGAFGAHVFYDKYVKPFFAPLKASNINNSSAKENLLKLDESA